MENDSEKKNSLQTWSFWGSELSLLLLLWRLIKETGTQIDVSICFTEYSQLSSLAAELWTPCCPLFFNSACMTTWMNIPLGTGFDTHTHMYMIYLCKLICSIWKILQYPQLVSSSKKCPHFFLPGIHQTHPNPAPTNKTPRLYRKLISPCRTCSCAQLQLDDQQHSRMELARFFFFGAGILFSHGNFLEP